MQVLSSRPTPAIARSMLDLPQPDCPTMSSDCPSFSSRLTSCANRGGVNPSLRLDQLDKQEQIPRAAPKR